ncbi:MAG: hypothetical protein HFE90_08365 [Firmicutes bacterium]|nr:hypothetical protein [Bacillota bacterium]
MYEFDDLLTNLPVAYRKDKWVNDLFNAITLQDKAERNKAVDMAAQMFLDSLSWNLKTEEYIAGVEVRQGSSIEDRKSILSAKWQSMIDNCDIELIRRICAAWDKGESGAEYDGQQAAVILKFIYENARETKDDILLDSIFEILRKTIPAHLLAYFTMQAAEAKTAVHIAAASCCYSRFTLTEIEPDRSASSTVNVYGASAVRSSGALAAIQPDRAVKTNIDIGIAHSGEYSKAEIKRLEE